MDDFSRTQIVRFLTDHGFIVRSQSRGNSGQMVMIVVVPGNGCYVATNPETGAGERKETIE